MSLKGQIVNVSKSMENTNTLNTMKNLNSITLTEAKKTDKYTTRPKISNNSITDYSSHSQTLTERGVHDFNESRSTSLFTFVSTHHNTNRELDTLNERFSKGKYIKILKPKIVNKITTTERTVNERVKENSEEGRRHSETRSIHKSTLRVFIKKSTSLQPVRLSQNLNQQFVTVKSPLSLTSAVSDSATKLPSSSLLIPKRSDMTGELSPSSAKQLDLSKLSTGASKLISLSSKRLVVTSIPSTEQSKQTYFSFTTPIISSTAINPKSLSPEILFKSSMKSNKILKEPSTKIIQPKSSSIKLTTLPNLVLTMKIKLESLKPTKSSVVLETKDLSKSRKYQFSTLPLQKLNTSSLFQTFNSPNSTSGSFSKLFSLFKTMKPNYNVQAPFSNSSKLNTSEEEPIFRHSTFATLVLQRKSNASHSKFSSKFSSSFLESRSSLNHVSQNSNRHTISPEITHLTKVSQLDLDILSNRTFQIIQVTQSNQNKTGSEVVFSLNGNKESGGKIWTIVETCTIIMSCVGSAMLLISAALCLLVCSKRRRMNIKKRDSLHSNTENVQIA